MEIKQESPAQLPSAIRLCSFALCFDLLIAFLLIPNLVTILVAIPLLHNACSYNLIGATGNFTLVVSSVMVLRLTFYGAATKPRAPVGAHTRLCCSARAGIEVSSHDPLQNYTDMLFSLELFLGYLSLSCQEIYMSNQMQQDSLVKLSNG